MLIKDSTLIPDWLKKNLEENCPFCDSPYHVGYSPNGLRVTRHYCPNRECPATLAMKMVFMWNILKVDGIKYGRSMELIKRYKIKKHIEAIKYVFDEKPTVDIVTFMRLQCINGIDNSWGSLIGESQSLEEVLDSFNVRTKLTQQDIIDIKEAAEYFNIVFPEKKQFDPVMSIRIMMTGDIMGLPDRNLFVQALNQKYNGLLRIEATTGVRKTGVYALVKEDNYTGTQKVRIAQEYGIRIFNPKDFIIHIDKEIKRRVGENNES